MTLCYICRYDDGADVDDLTRPVLDPGEECDRCDRRRIA